MGHGKPYQIFGNKIEPDAIHQFHEAMSHPSAIRGALMPDAHKGYSLPIGGVVLTDNFIFPSWVGYDIGCGMCAVPTSFSLKRIEKRAQQIFDKIYECVPVGFNHCNSVNSEYLEILNELRVEEPNLFK